jgi:hypothetical protein
LVAAHPRFGENHSLRDEKHVEFKKVIFLIRQGVKKIIPAGIFNQ